VDLGAELELRDQIFGQLAQLVAEKKYLRRDDLGNFKLNGEPCRLADRSKGIWNPRHLNATLSILSTPGSTYADQDLGDGLFAYAYREGSKDGDNAKLRRAFELQLPIIWNRGFPYKNTVRYIPVFPVYIVEDDPDNRRVIVSLDRQLIDLDLVVDDPDLEKRYSLTTTKRRLHQPKFRGRLLVAYKMRCAVCGMDVPKLLDGAHITPDADQEGTPTVVNGLAMCKIHHAAYDADLMAISPDYRIHISTELKRGSDSGPIITHGFRDLDGSHLAVLPDHQGQHPSKERLGARFQHFTSNSGIDVAWPSTSVEMNL
jgi:putative restriction endonuclease